jgi:NAD(P)-dependent dehydrogenase (short-subunit alcohol dehydrogenase family)
MRYFIRRLGTARCCGGNTRSTGGGNGNGERRCNWAGGYDRVRGVRRGGNERRRARELELDVVFHACQAVFPHMKKRGRGSIINVGSTSAKIAQEVLPALAHMGAKGGVVAMSKQIAMAGGKHQIRCNTLSPGLVLTAQTRAFINTPEWFAPMKAKLMLGRAGLPEDIAPLAVYLASDESSWVTGADFAIDGGTTAW